MAVTPKLPLQHSGAPVAFSPTIVQRGLALWKPGVQLTRQRELGSSLDCPLLSPSFLPDHCWLGPVASLAGFQTLGDPPVISFFMFELLYTWQARSPLDLLTEHWENSKDKEHCHLCGKNEWLGKNDGIIRRSQKIWYDQKAHTKAGGAAASKNKLLTKWWVCAIIVTWKSGPVIYGMFGDKQKVPKKYFWIPGTLQSNGLHCVVISLLWVLKMLWSCRAASISAVAEEVGLSKFVMVKRER